jgi:hypothetical protein
VCGLDKMLTAKDGEQLNCWREPGYLKKGLISSRSTNCSVAGLLEQQVPVPNSHRCALVFVAVVNRHGSFV